MTTSIQHDLPVPPPIRPESLGQQYGVMSDVMDALQEANAPRFNVQTDLAGKGGLFGKKK